MTNPGDLLTQEEKEQGIDAAVADLDFASLDTDTNPAKPASVDDSDVDLDSGSTTGGPELLTAAEKQAGIDAAVAGLVFASLDTAPVAPPEPTKIPPPRPLLISPPPPPTLTPAKQQARAKSEFIAAWKQTQEIKNEITEVKKKLKKYQGLGYWRIGLPKGEHEYKRLQAQLSELEGQSGKFEITREELEKAKQKAIRVGVAESELSGGEGDGAPPEVRADSVDNQKKWLWSKLIGRGVFEATASVLGVAAPMVIEQYVHEQKERGKITGEMSAILKEIKTSMTTLEATPAPDEAEADSAIEQKLKELRAKVDKLVDEGKISPERQEQILDEMGIVVQRHMEEKKMNEEEFTKAVGKIMNDYLETKISKFRITREVFNTGFVLTGLQFARGATMLTLGAVERAARQKREYELDIRARFLQKGGEEQKPEIWGKAKEVLWKRTVVNGIKEFGRSLAGKGATEAREGRKWLRIMDTAKAIGVVLRFVGIGSAVLNEVMHGGISGSIQESLDNLEKEGPGATAIKNFVRNGEKVFWLNTTGARGQETLTASDETPPAPVAVATEKIRNEFLDNNGVIKKLIVEESKGTLTVAIDGVKKLVINIGDKQGGFEHAQQALRRVVLEDMNVDGQSLNDVEMDRAEKIIKMITHNLRGEKLSERWFDKDFDQAKINALLTRLREVVYFDNHGGMVIADVDRFKEMMPEMENMADKYNVSMMAYINNTRHGILQDIMDARTAEIGAHITVDDFDKSELVHTAEHNVFLHESQALAGADIRDVRVVNEVSGSFVAHLGGDDVTVIMDHGKIDHITVGESAFIPAQEIGFQDFNGQTKLKNWASEVVQIKGGGHAAEAVAPTMTGAAHEVTVVHRPADLYHTVPEGGLKGPDGMLHLGGLSVKEGWFTEWDDQSVKDFIKDAPGRLSLSRWFSAESDARYRLAQAMESHKADMKMTVGRWTLENVKRLEDWVR